MLAITFEIEGQEFMALNGGPQFTFTPAISLFVHCGSQEEVDGYWTKLIEGGGSPWQCGWLKDRFGVSWQIVPDALGDMLRDPDDAKASRVMTGDDENGQARYRAAGAGVSGLNRRAGHAAANFDRIGVGLWSNPAGSSPSHFLFISGGT